MFNEIRHMAFEITFKILPNPKKQNNVLLISINNKRISIILYFNRTQCELHALGRYCTMLCARLSLAANRYCLTERKDG